MSTTSFSPEYVERLRAERDALLNALVECTAVVVRTKEFCEGQGDSTPNLNPILDRAIAAIERVKR